MVLYWHKDTDVSNVNIVKARRFEHRTLNKPVYEEVLLVIRMQTLITANLSIAEPA